MRRFEELEVVGDGAFGVVTKCRDKETGELVAIKKMKKRYSSFDECLQLKEVKSLRKIKHTNIVKLLQVFRENEYLFLVFELMGKSLLKTINNCGGYQEDEVRGIMNQVLTGLNYIHRQGFFHRDMKPDNLLWKQQNDSDGLGSNTLKIADFGLAREIRSRPPFTEYVATRWYRAPEIILRSDNYNSPVDIWACGVIMAELFIARPLFQGSSETDQLYKIFAIIGAPTSKSWPDGIKLANKMGIRFSTSPPIGLSAAIPTASPSALSLISSLLKYDPARRPSANQALHHAFFKDNNVNSNSNSNNNSVDVLDNLDNLENSINCINGNNNVNNDQNLSSRQNNHGFDDHINNSVNLKNEKIISTSNENKANSIYSNNIVSSSKQTNSAAINKRASTSNATKTTATTIASTTAAVVNDSDDFFDKY